MLQVLVAISQNVYYRDEVWAMQKLFIKKEVEKMDKCPIYLCQNNPIAPPYG